MSRSTVSLVGLFPLLRWLEQANDDGVRAWADAVSFVGTHGNTDGKIILSAAREAGLVKFWGFHEHSRQVSITEAGHKALARQTSPRHRLELSPDGDDLVLSLPGSGRSERLTGRRLRTPVPEGREAQTRAVNEILFGTEKQPRSLLSSVLDQLADGEWARMEIHAGSPADRYLWELARASDGQRLAARAGRWVSFIRRHAAGTASQLAAPEGRLAVAVGSGPGEQERQGHAIELGEHLRSRVGWEHVHVMEQSFGTPADLVTALQPCAPTIVYLVSHGTPGSLETGTGTFDGTALSTALSALPGCQLVILGVCHGGDDHKERAEDSLAMPLVRAGIPLVVTPLGRADLPAFSSFVHTFLRQLWRYGGVERAMWRGRREMYGGDPAYPAMVALFAGPGSHVSAGPR